MGLGLQGAYGVQGMQGALRQRILDQLDAEKKAQELQIQQQDLLLRTREAAGREADRRAALAERAQVAHEATAAKAFPQLPLGGAIDAATYGNTYKDTAFESNFDPERTLPATRLTGGVPLPTGALSGTGMGETPPPASASPQMPPMAPPGVENVPRRATGRMISQGTEAMQSKAADDAQVQQLLANPDTPPAVKQYLRVRTSLKGDAAVPYQLITEPNGPPKPPGPIRETTRGFERMNPDNTTTLIGDAKPYHAPQMPIVINQQGETPQLVNRGTGVATPVKDASGKPLDPTVSANVVTQRTNASNVRAHIAEINREAQQIDQLGLMGPVGGRWADFLAGRVGAGELAAGDPTKAKLLGKFRADVGLLKSGVAMVHGGSRGGGSPAIAARMDALINADHMDLPLFEGATSSFDEWLKTYEGPAKAGTTSSGGVKKYNPATGMAE